MKLDDSKLRDTFAGIHQGPLSPAEAATIVDVARFAASVDGRMDMGEMATVARLSKIIHALAAAPDAPVPSTPLPAGWLGDIATKLATTGARELAYACARLVVLVDRKVTKEESELVTKLGEALRLGTTRATEIDQAIDAIVRDADAKR